MQVSKMFVRLCFWKYDSTSSIWGTDMISLSLCQVPIGVCWSVLFVRTLTFICLESNLLSFCIWCCWWEERSRVSVRVLVGRFRWTMQHTGKRHTWQLSSVGPRIQRIQSQVQRFSKQPATWKWKRNIGSGKSYVCVSRVAGCLLKLSTQR